MLFLGEVEVGLWRGLCEDEVEGQAGSSGLGLPGRWLGASSAGRLVCREAVAKRPWHWVTQAGAQPQPQPQLGGAMLFLGEVEVGLWRGLCEDEVEGQAGSSGLGLPGRWLGASSAGRLVCREAVAKRPWHWVTQAGAQPQP